MTRPRCLDPKQTYLITRRCSERRFFLRPDDEVNNLLLYCLAEASRRFDVEVHAFVFLSNHYHLVISETSEEVRLPEFMAWLNMHVAKLINDVRGRRENLWGQGSYNAVVLVGKEAVVDKIVYTICNPVAAGLVPVPEQWPGLRSMPRSLENDTFTALHPGRVFSKEQPAQAELFLTRPPCLADLGRRAYRRLIDRQVRARVAEIHLQRARDGRPDFLGRAAVMEQNTEDRPTGSSGESGSSSGHPCLACADKRRRKGLLKALKEFGLRYRECVKAWKDGEREVVFPAGTYQMRRFDKVRCREGPGVVCLG